MQRKLSTADGTNLQILIGFGPEPSMYRNMRSLQQQNTVWNAFG